RAPPRPHPLPPAEPVGDGGCEPAVVDRVLDAIALGRVPAHIDPQIDEEPLPEAPLLLEIAVMAEHDQPSQLDPHALILPRSTATSSSSASTVSPTSSARIIDA